VFTIPDSFPLALAPLAWLVGSWAGEGVGGYPTVDTFGFEQQIDVTNDGRPFLGYTSRSWILDDDGARVRPAAFETGFWRPAHPPTDPTDADTDADAAAASGDVDLLLTHSSGFVEVWTGVADGPRISLQTDVVARTPTAKEYTAGTRVYGLVEGDLMWAFDMAAVGQTLQPHLSARLSRVAVPQ
jgi:hypothetical protein